MTQRLSEMRLIPRARDPPLEERYNSLVQTARSSGDALIKIVAMDDLSIPERVFLAHLIGKLAPRVAQVQAFAPATKQAIQGLN